MVSAVKEMTPVKAPKFRPEPRALPVIEFDSTVTLPAPLIDRPLPLVEAIRTLEETDALLAKLMTTAGEPWTLSPKITALLAAFMVTPAALTPPSVTVVKSTDVQLDAAIAAVPIFPFGSMTSTPTIETYGDEMEMPYGMRFVGVTLMPCTITEESAITKAAVEKAGGLTTGAIPDAVVMKIWKPFVAMFWIVTCSL
jgi:hypothetical protein